MNIIWLLESNNVGRANREKLEEGDMAG